MALCIHGLQTWRQEIASEIESRRIFAHFIGIFWKVKYTSLPAHHMDLDDFGLF